MNKLLLTSAIILAMASSAVFAHHPAAEIVDPEIYEMIDENVSDVHAAMTFDDMGGDTTSVGSAMESQDTDSSMDGDVADVGAAMESREVMSSMADREPRGATLER